MRLTNIALALFVLAPALPLGATEDSGIAALLEKQTQELFDAVSAGDAKVWDKYLDPDVRYTDENGTVSTKKEMVEGTKPLPAGVSGTIRVTDFHAAVHGDVAVATHVEDENEDYHGHALRCQYRTTDTWRKTSGGWRLVAGQVLALRTDPPSVPLSEARRREYSGTYGLAPGIDYEIRPKGERLEGRQTGRPWEEIRAEAPDVLFVPGKPRYRKIFRRDAAGRITGFAERREAWDILWTKR
ncbi:MAG TPA: nuclear transport factor 2 family protein [Thermoanaerobaculia bacterium]|nr:nuclear transport factor 2 family protein [Thermoanaerobaculia bacterium]